jgi:hypothetical protein
MTGPAVAVATLQGSAPKHQCRASTTVPLGCEKRTPTRSLGMGHLDRKLSFAPCSHPMLWRSSLVLVVAPHSFMGDSETSSASFMRLSCFCCFIHRSYTALYVVGVPVGARQESKGEVVEQSECMCDAGGPPLQWPVDTFTNSTCFGGIQYMLGLF